jgi:hypothetical protein
VKTIRVIKGLSLSLTALMVFGALDATGSASAAQLCVPVDAKHATDGKCPTVAEREVTPGEPVAMTSSNVVFTTSTTTVTCKESSMTTKVNTATGTPIAGEVSALSFTNDCTTSSGTSCTYTVVNVPYSASLESGNLKVIDAVGAGVKTVCGVLVNCTFSTKEAIGTVTHNAGGSTTIDFTVNLAREGGFCPATAEWHATYHSAANVTVL